MSTLEASQLEEQVKEIPMASASRLLKMGQDSACCGRTRRHSTAFVASSTQ